MHVYALCEAINLILILILGDWTRATGSVTLTFCLGLGRKHYKNFATIFKVIACVVGNEQISHFRQTTGMSWSQREIRRLARSWNISVLLGNPRMPIQKCLLIKFLCKTGWAKTTTSMSALLLTNKRNKFQFGNLNFLKEPLKFFHFILAKRCSC